jgi:hypothetical protein
MGTATSATTFGRSLGGAIGTALFGALLTARLSVYLARELGGSANSANGGAIDANNVQAIQALTEPVKTQVLTAYTHAITDIFLLAIPLIVVALVVVLFLNEIPLRTGRAPIVAEAEAVAEQAEEIEMPVFAGH